MPAFFEYSSKGESKINLQLKQNLIESVQYDAARVCTGALLHTSKTKLLRELGWETLSERRKYFKLIMFYKVLNNLVPQYVCNDTIKPVSAHTSYNLRNINKIRPPRARTNLYKMSFYPSASVLWNDLPVSVSQLDALGAFKKSLSKLLFPARPPSYLGDGERLPVIWHTRLRLGHSTLNYHGLLYGITDSDLCSCGLKEDVEHFFLMCPNYAALRTELLTSVSNLISPGVHYNLLLRIGKKHLIDVLLRGSSDLSTADNNLLFQAVHTFIKGTKRFENIFQF